MSTPKIIVTGANGQLGRELQKASRPINEYEFVYVSRQELAIQDASAVLELFQKHQPAFCINCAAYTAVDKAETEKEQAFMINAKAVGILADNCRQFHTKFIHISTDYVFDGTSSIALIESAPTHPINVYGASKLQGEELALTQNEDTIIIRTSWVYSEFGNNFVKTMMRLMREKNSIGVINDQIGSPTYAADLASAILKIIHSGRFLPGIYNYSNEGEISWFDFAVAIQKCIGSTCMVNPIPTTQYPTPAKRPSYSLLDKSKIKQSYHLIIPNWLDSLHICIENIRKQEA